MNAKLSSLKGKFWKSHGTGKFNRRAFGSIGKNVVFENGVLIFHPENIQLGNHVYIGHYTVLKAYYLNRFVIGDHVWIGQGCFFHSAGGIHIGNNVGIGPSVKIISSAHSLNKLDRPILQSPLKFAKVIIEDDSDIGIGSIILPGVVIGKGAQVGAGAVVTKNVPKYSIVAGVPAKVVSKRI